MCWWREEVGEGLDLALTERDCGKLFSFFSSFSASNCSSMSSNFSPISIPVDMFDMGPASLMSLRDSRSGHPSLILSILFSKTCLAIEVLKFKSLSKNSSRTSVLYPNPPHHKNRHFFPVQSPRNHPFLLTTTAFRSSNALTESTGFQILASQNSKTASSSI